MTPLFDSQDYYRKMLELQEKLRKSEEDRIRLEERFNLLEKESQIRHEACINKLRMRYIEFLEEQRLRDERNNKLLGALDRVDSSLALMTAKTDKLCSLRKEYEASMLRAYVSRRQPGSVTGDSGIVSHNEDIRHRKYTHSSPTFPSASNISLYTPNPPRRYDYPSTSNFFSKPLSYPERPVIHCPEPFPSKPIRDLNTTWGYSTPRLGVTAYSSEPDPFKRATQYLSKDTSPFPYPETIRSPKTTKLTSLLMTPNIRTDNAGSLVENELDKYINKIRSLHGDLDQSLEEVDHEQNTSGDLLNVTLSEDGTEHLSAEEKSKEQVPEEITKVLAIAEDLASRTIDETAEHLSEPNPNVFEKLNDCNSSPINEKQLEPRDSDKIRSIAKRETEIEQPECTKIITKTPQSEEISASVQLNSEDYGEPSSDNKNTEEELNVGKEVTHDVPVTEELEPWSTENSVPYVEEVKEIDPGSKTDTEIHETACEIAVVDRVEVGNIIATNEVEPENAKLANEEDVEKDQLSKNYQNVTTEQVDENYQDTAVYDYNNQENNYQYPDQEYQYNQEYNYDTNNQEAVGNYDPNAQYQKNYQQDTPYQAENYDPNVQYQSENYQDPNIQYQNSAYEYSEDPNQYQGEYPTDNQEHNMENYEYNYDQGEGYQGEAYQEYPVGITGDEQQTVSDQPEISTVESSVKEEEQVNEKNNKKKDVIKSILESETESSIEKNTTNTESDFDFN